MPPERRTRPRRTGLALSLVGLSVLLLGGCYQDFEADPEEQEPRTADYEPEHARADDPDARADDGGETADLPGEIPPAVGAPDDPAAAGTAGGGTTAGTAIDGTDDQVERRGVTAFVGASSRGQYLTEQVAMCVQCHSPKDESGRVVPQRKFQGGPIPVGSPYRGRDWATEAPPLVGLEFYDRDELVRLLTEGIARDGEPPRPPMPPFRMSADDAGAIYDYLSSLRRER